MEPIAKPINRQMRALHLLEGLRELAREHLTPLELETRNPAQWGTRLGEKLSRYLKNSQRPRIPQYNLFSQDENGRRYSVATETAKQVVLIGDCWTRCVLCGTIEPITFQRRAGGDELRNHTRCEDCRSSKA